MIRLTVDFFKQANPAATKKGLTGSKQTPITGFQQAARTVFSAAELWDIQRRGKTVMPRRWSF